MTRTRAVRVLSGWITASLAAVLCSPAPGIAASSDTYRGNFQQGSDGRVKVTVEHRRNGSDKATFSANGIFLVCRDGTSHTESIYGYGVRSASPSLFYEDYLLGSDDVSALLIIRAEVSPNGKRMDGYVVLDRDQLVDEAVPPDRRSCSTVLRQRWSAKLR